VVHVVKVRDSAPGTSHFAKQPENLCRLALFPGRLPLRSLDCIRDLWTARRSGRRPGITSTSSNRKVDSIMTYVDSVQRSHMRSREQSGRQPWN